jgi:aspartyl-tRNA(Asn)/glutamyl-tRNA(Gln) amidotransferase subunit C
LRKEHPVAIDRSIVAHISRLAYIDLSEDEMDEMADGLSSVLEHVSRLQSVETEGVDATGHAIPRRNVMREDEVRPSWQPAAVLANAPSHEADQFEVQAVLE